MKTYKANKRNVNWNSPDNVGLRSQPKSIEYIRVSTHEQLQDYLRIDKACSLIYVSILAASTGGGHPCQNSG